MSIRQSDTSMSFPAGLVINQVVEDSDHMKAIAAFWRMEQLQIDQGIYRGHLQAAHSPHVQLATTLRARSSQISGDVPPDTYVFAARLAEPGTTYYRGEMLRPRDLAFVQAGEDFTYQLMGESNVLSVAVASSAIDAYVGGEWTRSPLERKRHGLLHLTAPTGTVALRLRALLGLSLQDPTLLTEPQAVAHFEQQIFDLLLGSVDQPAPTRAVPLRRQIARQAEEFLRLHASRPFVLQELCRLLRTSARTLELGFHEVYGMSLKAYLQSLRFNGARRDLIAGEPRTLSVKEVALRWGFLHLGRFAVNYRRWFGESPSTTLAR